MKGLMRSWWSLIQDRHRVTRDRACAWGVVFHCHCRWTPTCPNRNVGRTTPRRDKHHGCFSRRTMFFSGTSSLVGATDRHASVISRRRCRSDSMATRHFLLGGSNTNALLVASYRALFAWLYASQNLFDGFTKGLLGQRLSVARLPYASDSFGIHLSHQAAVSSKIAALSPHQACNRLVVSLWTITHQRVLSFVVHYHPSRHIPEVF